MGRGVRLIQENEKSLTEIKNILNPLKLLHKESLNTHTFLELEKVLNLINKFR